MENNNNNYNDPDIESKFDYQTTHGFRVCMVFYSSFFRKKKLNQKLVCECNRYRFNVIDIDFSTEHFNHKRQHFQNPKKRRK